MKGSPSVAISLAKRLSSGHQLSSFNTTAKPSTGYSLWHHKLGHALISKLQYVDGIDCSERQEVCLTCPMAKMSPLPFSLSSRKTTTTITPPPSVILLTWGLGRSEGRQPYPYKYQCSQRGQFQKTHVNFFWENLL